MRRVGKLTRQNGQPSPYSPKDIRRALTAGQGRAHFPVLTAIAHNHQTLIRALFSVRYIEPNRTLSSPLILRRASKQPESLFRSEPRAVDMEDMPTRPALRFQRHSLPLPALPALPGSLPPVVGGSTSVFSNTPAPLQRRGAMRRGEATTPLPHPSNQPDLTSPSRPDRPLDVNGPIKKRFKAELSRVLGVPRPVPPANSQAAKDPPQYPAQLPPVDPFGGGGSDSSTAPASLPHPMPLRRPMMKDVGTQTDDPVKTEPWRWERVMAMPLVSIALDPRGPAEVSKRKPVPTTRPLPVIPLPLTPPISPLRDGHGPPSNLPQSDFNKPLPAIPFPSPPILLHAPQPRRPLLVEPPEFIVGSREPSPSPSITLPQTPTTPPPIHDSPSPEGTTLATLATLASPTPPPPRPTASAPASAPAPRPRKFGGTGSCPACGILVCPLERGTIAGPRGTRWHAKCLKCGGGPMIAISAHRPGQKRAGCGKALDDGASLDEQGHAWCRLCFVSDYPVCRL